MVKMSERAIEEYKKSEAEREMQYKNATRKFAEEVKKRFIGLFKISEEDLKDLTVHPLSPYSVELIFQDLVFYGEENDKGNVVFYVQVKCKKCGKEFCDTKRQSTVWDLQDIGRELLHGYVCNECLEKEENERLERIRQEEEKEIITLLKKIYELIREE